MQAEAVAGRCGALVCDLADQFRPRDRRAVTTARIQPAVAQATELLPSSFCLPQSRQILDMPARYALFVSARVATSTDEMSTIYLRHGGTYVAMTETQYLKEDVLQALLAQHPEILAVEGHRAAGLLLVRREASVKDSETGGGRWSLDHLYLDADGIPTLVEVKRSSDTRGRREVVAQMLDYAANAKVSFSIETLVAWTEEASHLAGTTVADALANSLGVDDPDEFWQRVATNLEAERFRLIFVSDAIGPELRRIIEFLNGQMTRTEVLAIEVKQYTDASGQQQTIVPRLIGDTADARATKGAPGVRVVLDRDRLITILSERSDGAASAADAVLQWAEQDPRLEIRWSVAANIRVESGQQILRIWPDGTLEVHLETLRRPPTHWSEDRIEQFCARLNEVAGVALGDGRRWPRLPLDPLANAAARDSFVRVMNGALQDLAA